MEEESVIDQDLYKLVLHGRSTELDAYLHKKPYACQALTVVKEYNNEYLNLLMLAALNGHDVVVRLILAHCPDEVELEGCVHSVTGEFIDNVTALWCALDRAHYRVARTLIDLGFADVDHGPLHPLSIDATFKGRFDIVHFLVENGYAHVDRTATRDEYQNTGLFLAASAGYSQIVGYLISRGANIEHKNFPFQDTALTVAAQKGHLTSIQFLCLAGASLHVKNSNGKTPLMLATQNGHYDAVGLLLDYNHDETSFNDLELVASSSIVSNDHITVEDLVQMVVLLRQSFHRRSLYNIPKRVSQSIAAYDFHQECQSIDELEQIKNDGDRLHIEALLIQERILLPRRDETLFEPLLVRGEILVERGHFDHCFHLWLHVFDLYQQMERETNLHGFVWLFCRMITAQVSIPVDQFLQAARLIFEPSLQKSFDDHVYNELHLLAIASKILDQETMCIRDRRSIIQWVKELCQKQRTTEIGQTLLHLSVDVQTYYKINYRPEDIRAVLSFPNLGATRLLVDCGKRWIDLDAIDRARGDTALHNISRVIGHDVTTITKLLIEAGAHSDCVNSYGRTPLDEAVNTEIRTLLRSHVTPPRLKCLCARLITGQQLAYDRLWPEQTPLNTFLRLHGALVREHSISDISDLLFHYGDDSEGGYLSD